MRVNDSILMDGNAPVTITTLDGALSKRAFFRRKERQGQKESEGGGDRHIGVAGAPEIASLGIDAAGADIPDECASYPALTRRPPKR
jgi:hypothetical protein